MKQLRGVCIGAGYFSRSHCEAWARLPGVEIVALADLSADKARESPALHRIPRAVGAPFECTGEDYLKSTALVEACYRSQATGQVVAVAP